MITPTAKLDLNALATSASRWMFALTTRTATTESQTSVTSKTLRTPLASTVRAENANQVNNLSFCSLYFHPPIKGCVTDANCPGGYTCQDHICHYPPGKVLIESISIRTQTGCSDCSKEGVTLSLLGEKNGQYPNGVPCATRTLDHAGSTDFDGGKARFDGTLGGAEDDAEKSMMGGCYQVHFCSESYQYLNDPLRPH